MKRFLRLSVISRGSEEGRVYAVGARAEIRRLFRELLPASPGLLERLRLGIASRELIWLSEPWGAGRSKDEAVARLLERAQRKLHWSEAYQGLFTTDPVADEFREPPFSLTRLPSVERLEDLAVTEALVDQLRAAALEEAARLESPNPRREKMLLHVCCGPDAAGVIGQLKRDFDLVAFWYDPNIQPREEYDKRLEAFLKVAELEGIEAKVGEYDESRFAKAIRGLEHTPEQGAKCSLCYDLRLERAAREAQALGMDLYATTLAISPHKVQEKLRRFGELNEARGGVPYFHRNFMRHGGFKDSVEYTKAHGIYRQDYCGCYYSLAEGGADARSLAGRWGLTEGLKAEELERRAQDLDPVQRRRDWEAYQEALARRSLGEEPWKG